MQPTAESGAIGNVTAEVRSWQSRGGAFWIRLLSFVSGLGMMLFSALTIRYFFLANYPTSIHHRSFCNINTFFNCNSSAHSMIAAIAGVPLGYFGLFIGALVSLGALFPSAAFERSNRTIALLNAIVVISLLPFSVFYLKTFCPLCSGYFAFSLVSFVLLCRFGIDRDSASFLHRFFRPSPKHLAVFAVLLVSGAYALRLFHETKEQAQLGVAARFVAQYFDSPMVKTPSIISPYWVAKSTDRFEDAPIQVVEYADFLCPDSLYLENQLEHLKSEFKGKINIAFQFFPLEKSCNAVANKNKHLGGCELAYIAAYNPAKFQELQHEIFANFQSAKRPEWRRELAKRYGADAALTDPSTKDRVQKIISTGAEYATTPDKYARGIHFTPTMIINNRMIVGTFPYEHLRAVFKALEQKSAAPGKQGFIEEWQD